MSNEITETTGTALAGEISLERMRETLECFSHLHRTVQSALRLEVFPVC